MFLQLKKILLDEINEEVEKALNIREEIKDLQEKLTGKIDENKLPSVNVLLKGAPELTIINKIKKIEGEIEDLSKQLSNNPRNNHNWGEKDPILFKIVYFKSYIKSKKEHAEKIKQFDLKKQELEKQLREKQDELKKLKNDRDKILERLSNLKKEYEDSNYDALIEKYEKIREAENLDDLGLDFLSAVQIFEKHNIPVIIDESDKIFEKDCLFNSLDDLILVHLTRFAPKNNTIKTLKNSTKINNTIKFGNQNIDIEFVPGRDTVHFAINGSVKGHEYGQWADCKYAVIIPLDKVTNIVNFNTSDTFTKGDVDITGGYLLCPENEIDNLKRLNPNVIVIGYKGNNIYEDKEGYADKFISILGYKIEPINKWGWENNDSEKVWKFIEGSTDYRQSVHYDSPEEKEQNISTGINQLTAIIEKVLELEIDFDVYTVVGQLLGLKDSKSQLCFSEPRLICEFDRNIFVNFFKSLEKYGIQIPKNIENYYINFDKNDKEKYNNIPKQLKELNEDFGQYSKELFYLIYTIFDELKKIIIKRKEEQTKKY